jgi:hypothetical protein
VEEKVSHISELPKDHSIATKSNHELCMQKLHSCSQCCVQKSKLAESCQRSRIRAAKILRVKMPAMDAVLQAIPDLHVIHYFRDPRAVFRSRDEGKSRDCQGSREQDCLALVKTLCREMAEDIELSAPLRSKYPGAFMTLR